MKSETKFVYGLMPLTLGLNENPYPNFLQDPGDKLSFRRGVLRDNIGFTFLVERDQVVPGLPYYDNDDTYFDGVNIGKTDPWRAMRGRSQDSGVVAIVAIDPDNRIEKDDSGGITSAAKVVDVVVFCESYVSGHDNYSGSNKIKEKILAGRGSQRDKRWLRLQNEPLLSGGLAVIKGSGVPYVVPVCKLQPQQDHNLQVIAPFTHHSEHRTTGPLVLGIKGVQPNVVNAIDALQKAKVTWEEANRNPRLTSLTRKEMLENSARARRRILEGR